MNVKSTKKTKMPISRWYFILVVAFAMKSHSKRDFFLFIIEVRCDYNHTLWERRCCGARNQTGCEGNVGKKITEGRNSLHASQTLTRQTVRLVKPRSHMLVPTSPFQCWAKMNE